MTSGVKVVTVKCRKQIVEMSGLRLNNNELLFSSVKVNESFYVDKKSSMDAEGDKASSCEDFSRPVGNWSEAFSSLSNVNAKLTWRNGAEKLSQTFNNVKTTFGVLSQRIKKSTKRRKPLVNIDSPGSPVTPYTRSKASLGRTPTKLYSPFSIDTPKGKENLSRIAKSSSSSNTSTSEETRRPRRLNLDECNGSKAGESVLVNDMLETQIGIYEFHSVANRIVQNRPIK